MSNWNLGSFSCFAIKTLTYSKRKMCKLSQTLVCQTKKKSIHIFSFFFTLPLSGKKIRTSSITAERTTSTTSARPSAPRKLTSIRKTKRYRWSPTPEICRLRQQRTDRREEKWFNKKVSVETLRGRASVECRKIKGTWFCQRKSRRCIQKHLPLKVKISSYLCFFCTVIEILSVNGVQVLDRAKNLSTNLRVFSVHCVKVELVKYLMDFFTSVDLIKQVCV